MVPVRRSPTHPLILGLALASISAACGERIPSGDGGVPGMDGGSGGGVGTVTLTQTISYDGSMVRTYAQAEFLTPRAPQTHVCTARTVDAACTVTTCTFQPNPPDAGLAAFSHAGTITIRGVRGAPIELMPSFMDRVDYVRSGTSVLYTGGEAIQFQAAGASDGLPAFEQTVTAPATVHVDRPQPDEWSAVGRIRVQRSQPLVVTWTDGRRGDTVVVELVAPPVAPNSHERVRARCTYAAESGTATVPAAAMETFPAGRDGGLIITVTNRATLTVGGYRVDVSVSQSGSQDGGVAGGPTVYE